MKCAAELPIRVAASQAGAAEATIVLDPDFAGFSGHFPDEAVLPGMFHVDLAVRAASEAFGAPFDLVTVGRARFLRKVRPGEELRIRLVLRSLAEGHDEIVADHSVRGESVAELRLGVIRRADPGRARR